MTLAQPLWLLALLALPLLFLARKQGYIGFSDLRLTAGTGDSRAVKIAAKLSPLFMVASLVLTVVALAQPQMPGDPLPRTIAGRDIVLAVDISYSMSYPFKGELIAHETPPELDFKVPLNERRQSSKGLQLTQPEPGKLKRIDAAQDAIMRFIENRWRNKTGDRIGLIVFDNRPRYAWPITDDLRMLYRKAQFLRNNLGMGTNFGNKPPGPIDLAIEHFRENGQAKSKVLILVSDGEDQIDPATQDRLIKLLTENHVRFYMVGVGETLARNDVDILRLADYVGGRVFRVEDAKSMQDCFDTIDRLEKSEVTVAQMETHEDVFYIFAWAALASLLAFLLSRFIVPTR